ncbi:MAG: ankyrin repeat domain-containing protein, partial [Candidatus Anstonellales archaeon]
MEVKDKEKKKFDSKGGKKEAGGEGMKEERRLSEEEVFRRVLESVRSRKEDEEAFEELRRINRERKGEDKRRAERLGKKLIDECIQEKEEISLERVVKLVLEGADVNVQDNNNGWTALMLAAEKEHEGIVEMLIKAGAKLDLQNKDGETALMLAAEKEHEGIVEMLRKEGADPFIVNNKGNTAYDLARNEEIKRIIKDEEKRKVKEIRESIRKWKEEGMKEEERPKGLETVFIWAALKGNTELVKELIDLVDVNTKVSGNTALMLAAEKEHEGIVEMLLKAGADPFIVNNNRESAYDLAGNKKIKKMLDNYMKRIKRVLRKMEKEEGLNKKEEKLMKVALKMA